MLLDHFQHHCPISQHQWGFQAGKSTTTALAATIHDWHSHLDVGRDVAMGFFDFKKAFDTVPHRRLLEKLSQVHLCTYVVDLIESYLTERSQCVVVNGASSQPVHVLSGVPQGSVLGPLLFIFYVNTLKLSGGSKLVMYADDLVLHKAIITEEEWIPFQNDINSIVQWVDENLLTLNTSKCKCMLLTRKVNTMPHFFLRKSEVINTLALRFLQI